MLKQVFIIVSLLFSPPILAEVGTYDSVRELFSKDFWKNKKGTKKRVIEKAKVSIVRDFMKMCLKPSQSQRVTLDAVIKNMGFSMEELPTLKKRCEKISTWYIEDKGLNAILLTGENITDVTPLQYLVQVNKLSLRNNNIRDISPYQSL